MHVGLVSTSRDPEVTLPVLQRIADALDTQQNAHYAPFWQSGGVAVRAYASLKDMPADASPILIEDEPDRRGTLAWHSSTDDGKAFGRCFWGVIKGAGGTLLDGALSLSVTLSHEVLEAVHNPYVNFWADMPGGLQEAIELCDRVQADSYVIDGVSVSNFLGPRAFRDGPGPYDWMRLLDSAWALRPGGYCIRRRGGGEKFEVWGAHLPARGMRHRDLAYEQNIASSVTQRRHVVV